MFNTFDEEKTLFSYRDNPDEDTHSGCSYMIGYVIFLAISLIYLALRQ